MEAKNCLKYYVRNTGDGQTVSLVGEGEFTIGLTLDERIACSAAGHPQQQGQYKAGPGTSGSGATADDSTAIVVPLVVLTVWRTAGVTVAAASRDLRCRLNGQDIAMEAHLIPGNQVEVGDKQLELLDEEPLPVLPAAVRPMTLSSGITTFTSSASESSSSVSPSPSRTPTPSGQTTRRQLPPTPGVPILPVPPRKPRRVYHKRISSDGIGLSETTCPPSVPAPQTVKDVGKDALREWCRVQLPNSEKELLHQTKNQEQLASLASSYLGRHVNLYTGVVMTADLTDRIFQVMLEVAHHRRDILHHFLTEVIDEFVADEENAEEKSGTLNRTIHSESDMAHHATVMTLLVEILKQFLDPQFLVQLCLQLLRALSHIPGSVQTMVENHIAASVLGSMAAYREDSSIQSFCLDILAKVATYVPAVLEKPPLRESSIDLVMMALTIHYKKLPIAQAGLRTLANLACSLHFLSFSAMKDKPYPELVDFVTQVVSVMVYLYETTSSMVRQCLGHFSDDLTVKMDGRRFLFESTKMEQLKQQQKLWEVQPEPDKNHKQIQDSEPVAENQDGDNKKNCRYLVDSNKSICATDEVTTSSDEEDNGLDRLNVNDNGSDQNGSSSFGILKKSRSYENLRTPDRRVSFINENDLTNLSSGASSSSSSGVNSPSKEIDEVKQGGYESPDIQVLSRSIIMPVQLSLGDSTDGEAGPTCSENSVSSDQTTSLVSKMDYGPPPPKPARRPIGAPLVHINSQSTDTDDNVDSSPPPPLPERNRTASASPNLYNGLEEDGGHQVAYQDSDQTHVYSLDQTHSPYHRSSPLIPGDIHESSVDLANFRYSAADIMFMKRLLSVQVTCQVCATSARGQAPHALKMIDMPLDVLLNQADIPKCLFQFFRSQYTVGTTLMDVDPSTVISVIDAIRYEVLVFDLVRGSLAILVQSLSDKLSTVVFAAALEVMEAARHNPGLTRVYNDKEFLQRVTALVKKVTQTTEDRPEINDIMKHLQQIFSDEVVNEKAKMRKASEENPASRLS
ncbi:hypothetical protein RRG08_035675 [Elysia crispata]|uniref:Uncharacterized protein n=1 Tax=Elysia crispata TaxID=231223 RepID=A0AAE0YAI9_9GAST|nr:hypothetical protein RRG08_035675 [Elysia crispata]